MAFFNSRTIKPIIALKLRTYISVECAIWRRYLATHQRRLTYYDERRTLRWFLWKWRHVSHSHKIPIKHNFRQQQRALFFEADDFLTIDRRCFDDLPRWWLFCVQKWAFDNPPAQVSWNIEIRLVYLFREKYAIYFKYDWYGKMKEILQPTKYALHFLIHHFLNNYAFPDDCAS